MTEATAQGMVKVAKAMYEPSGHEAANNYIDQFGKLAKENNTMIIPSNLAYVSSMVATAMSTVQHGKGKGNIISGEEPEVKYQS